MKNHSTTVRDAHPFKSLGRRLSCSIALACLAVALLVSLFCYRLYCSQCVRASGHTALSVAKTLANAIDGDRYAETMEKTHQDEFWNEIKTILDKTHADTETARVYAVSHGAADHYRFFASAHDETIDIGLDRHKDRFAKEIEDALNNGEFANSGLYENDPHSDDGYEQVISGFAPIKNSKGKVVGAVGVDIAMDSVLTSARHFLYGTLCALAILAGGMGAFILWQTKRSIMKPLELITEASRRLANGETDLHELPVDRNDEIGLLARHFNQVARSVNSLTVGFIGSSDSWRRDREKAKNANNMSGRVTPPTGSHVPTAGLSGRFLATAQGINMVLTILDTIESMVYVVDPNTHRFIFYSRKFGEHFNIEREKAWTRKCWQAIGRDRPCDVCDIDKLKMANKSYPEIIHEEYEENRDQWVWIRNRLIHWFDGRIVYLSEGRDISDTKRAQGKQAEQERRLRETTHAAEEANRMKTAFLANMSHEIRTPLNGVIGFAELAMEEPGTPERTREFLGKISDSGEGLLQLINDILDVSKIETGKMQLENIPFSVNQVFDLCEAICRPKAMEKGLELEFVDETGLDRQLSGDPTKLRQIILNLVSNSLKFTASGSVRVACRVRKRKDRDLTLLFEVQDDGIGMSPEQVEKIFKPFTQADNSITRKYGGTGLGLSISQSIVELMGGEIHVASSPGHGSTFSFTVPVRELDAPAGSKKGETTVIRSRPIFSGDALVCEDNQINREVIEEHLRRVGLNPVMAENGELGVTLAEDRLKSGRPEFSVIFMDIHMPHMDGVEATRRLRRLGVRAPIVALTANVMATERERYIREGMADCLGKPFNAKKLWRCLMRFLDPVKLAVDREVEPPEPAVSTGPLDREAGLVNAAGNEELYRRQLRHFARDYGRDRFLNRLDQALEQTDFKMARTLAHTLKGVSAMIGARDLSASAGEMEDLLADGQGAVREKQNLSPADAGRLAAARARLEREIRFVLTELGPFTGDTTTARVIAKPGPAPLNRDLARQLLTRVLPLLQSGDSSALEFVERLREALAPMGKEGTMLVEQIEDYNFENAAENAESLLKQLRT